MMFILRSDRGAPQLADLQVKAARRTPAVVPDSTGKTDYFCVGGTETMAALRAEGWNVDELRDGWYADDAGGGVGISGQGRYWEVRDTPFTVKEAAGPTDVPAATGGGEEVNVRQAIFGV